MLPDALALLDVERSERFVLSEAHTADLVPASELPWETVAAALDDPVTFMVLVAHSRPLPMFRVRLLQRSWAVQQGLVEGNQLQRLVWMLKTFHDEIEFDLLQRVGVDVGELWRARRWRLLLNLIDRLPRNTWTQQAMANHPEYAERVAESLAARRDKPDADEPWTLPLIDYTPEVAALASVVDAVNALRAVTIAANSKAGVKPPVIPPYPRPTTLVDTMVGKAQRQSRWTAHKNLADRLLAGRTPPQP